MAKPDLKPIRLKNSELILGILIGMFISILSEVLVILFGMNRSNAWIWIYISFASISILIVIYRRVIGFPDFLEVICKFKKSDNFDWIEFGLMFYNSLSKALRNSEYRFLKVSQYRWAKYGHKLLGYSRSEITRTRWGTPWAFIYLYRGKQEFRFLVGIPTFSTKDDFIIDTLKDVMQDLKNKKIINNCNFGKKIYYHQSWWYPFKKKGKQLDEKQLIEKII